MKWRDELDKELRQYVDDLIKKTTFFSAYQRADKPANAQLWTALGIMAKKLYEQELKIGLLEGVLKEISPRKNKERTREEIKKSREEVERIMKEIARGKPVIVPPKPNQTIKSSMVFPKLKKSKKSRKDIEDIKERIKSNF
jgi:hypothetical protein